MHVAAAGFDVLTERPQELQKHADDLVVLKGLFQQSDLLLQTGEGIVRNFPIDGKDRFFQFVEGLSRRPFRRKGTRRGLVFAKQFIQTALQLGVERVGLGYGVQETASYKNSFLTEATLVEMIFLRVATTLVPRYALAAK